MKAEDFSIWLCGVARLSADQRRKALAALADVDGGGEGMEQKAASETLSNGAAGKAPRRRRPDALGTSGHERVESRGCPHCAGREVIAWGRSRGLSRFRCKGCGRTFNALTKTPMAHLRKRERWLDHAQAMIEGKSLAKTAGLCGVHSTTAFRWRHRFLGSPAGDCLEIGGVRPQPLLAGADRWRAGISVRSRSRACHYRRRCEPEAEDPPLAATSASAAICSSGGSPENWPSLR